MPWGINISVPQKYRCTSLNRACLTSFSINYVMVVSPEGVNLHFLIAFEGMALVPDSLQRHPILLGMLPTDVRRCRFTGPSLVTQRCHH